MSNVIDFSRKKKNLEKGNQIVKAAQIICPCKNNTFAISCTHSTGQIYLMLRCVNCNQSYDVTEMLTEMLDKEKKQNMW